MYAISLISLYYVFMRIDQQILSILLSENEPVSSKKLSFQLGISEKTIQKYMGYLKETLASSGATLETKQRVGSYISIKDKEKFQEFLISFNNASLMEDPTLRKRYILTRLVSTDEYINIYDLSDEINISPTLTRNIFKELSTIVQKYDLKLEHSHFNGYRIIGDESNIRRILAKECKESDYLVNTITNSTLNINEKDTIHQIIASTLESLNISVSNESINSLTLHTLIAINRFETDNPITLKDDFMLVRLKSKPEYFAAQQIFKQLSEKLNIVLPENEIIYFTLHISGQQRIYGHEQLQVTINESAIVFYNKFLRNIWKYTNEDFFKDDELRTSLLNHIVPFLTRIQNNMQIEKSELNNIKSEFPYAYDLSVTGLYFLEEKGIHLTEVEISYFALHLQLSLEKRKADQEIKYNILVFTDEASSIFHMLSYKINLHFEDKINEVVFASTNDIDKYYLNDFHLILSTSANDKLPSNTINISPLMTQKDIETITQAINQLSSRIINTIVLRDYLFFDLDVSSKDECIKETVKLINEYISLPEDFLERVQTRESLASTEYNNRIAMPHPINMIDIPEFVAVARLQKPILWNEKNVQLVFLVCNRGEINTWVYEKLTKIIASSEISSSLIQAKSFNEFRDIIEKI